MCRQDPIFLSSEAVVARAPDGIRCDWGDCAGRTAVFTVAVAVTAATRPLPVRGHATAATPLAWVLRVVVHSEDP